MLLRKQTREHDEEKLVPETIPSGSGTLSGRRWTSRVSGGRTGVPERS